MEPVLNNHIEITPGICGGKPRIAGSRIRVEDIMVWHERMGYSPEEIVTLWPQLTLANVYAALAYYFDHMEEIRRTMEENEAFVAEIEAKTPSLLVPNLGKR